MTEIEHTGRCLCGAVRYRATGAPKWIANCHCDSCRRATGAPVTTYAGFPAERFAYVAGEPARFHSSPGVTRTFCGRCGSQIVYRHDDAPALIELTTATLDDPEVFPPTREIWLSHRVSWEAVDRRREQDPEESHA